jgi:SAM-dependent methyltransferase
VAFAARGVPVVAVEPDGAMADVLARHTARTPGVRIVRSTFEQYRPEREFGLLYCADAWHWTRPETRWSLAARALRPGGTLALFWNNDRIADPALRQAMLDTLTAAIPSITVNDSGATQDTLWDLWPGAELAEQPEFGDFAGHVYASHRTVSGRDYLTHMSTRSQCRMLAPPVRERLFSALADVFPDEVPLAADTALHLARRRPA